jgi:hypothetical protein
VKGIHYRTPHYTVFSSLLCSFSDRSRCISQLPFIYVLPLGLETKLTHTKTFSVIILYILIFRFLDQSLNNERLWTKLLKAFPRFNLLNFFMDVIIFSYRFSRNMRIFSKDLLNLHLAFGWRDVSLRLPLLSVFRLIYLRISYTVSVIWSIYNFIQHIIMNIRNIAYVS